MTAKLPTKALIAWPIWFSNYDVWPGCRSKSTPVSILDCCTQSIVKYICLVCNQVEEIPLNVVTLFDAMDDGDPTVPPQFSCEKCGGDMRF